MKLLTIDDSRMIRRVICDVAATIGFETIEAESGGSGLQAMKAETEAIELVLLDWNMPGMNGLEVLKEIKADQDLQHIPVMMVTTEGERKNIVAAIQAGAVNYVTKPFTQEDLATKIYESLGMGGA